MAVYSVNQATHLYVLGAEPTNVAGSGYVRYSGLGANKDLATDLIAKSKVLSVTNIPAIDLVPKAKIATVTISGTDADADSKIDGGTYVMRVIIDNYFSESPSGSYIKHASAYVKNGVSVNDLCVALADSLELGLKRDIEKAFKVELLTSANQAATVANGKATDAAKIKITPIPTEWVLGRKSTTIPQISVELVPTNELDTEADWGTVTYAEGAPEAGERKLEAEILADYEYFCLGERGDQYRGIGWPNNVETKGEVNPETSGYYVVTVHYYEDLPNEAVQKSEKTAVFVCTSEEIATAVANAFKGATNTELDSRVADLEEAEKA
jgi:hypothetical protein